MNKKTNTFLFIVVATLFNIFIMIVLMIIFFAVPPILIRGEAYKKVIPYLMPILFLAAIVLTFFIYNLIMKYVSKKIDMEKYFHPIFKRKK